MSSIKQVLRGPHVTSIAYSVIFFLTILMAQVFLIYQPFGSILQSSAAKTLCVVFIDALVAGFALRHAYRLTQQDIVRFGTADKPKPLRKTYRALQKQPVVPVTVLRTLGYALLMLALTVLGQQIITGIGFVRDVQQNQANLVRMSELNIVTFIMSTVIIAPIMEELVFRYYGPRIIQWFYTEPLPTDTAHIAPRGLRNHFTARVVQNGHILSYLIATLVFISIHSPNGVAGWLSYSTGAFVLLYVRIKHNNILASIALHIVWNGFATFLMFGS